MLGSRISENANSTTFIILHRNRAHEALKRPNEFSEAVIEITGNANRSS
jgi:hypothetical protein